MKLSLSFAPNSCALIPYVLLVEAGAEFAVAPVNFMRGEHVKPDFLAINPRHKVPVLLRDGVPLTETVAMQVWIAETFPEARLLPDGLEARVQALSLSAWCASNIHPTLTPNLLPERYCDLPDSADSVRRCAQKLMHEAFRLMDERLAGRTWFFDRMSCPDVHFFWCFRRAKQFRIDVSAYAACEAHFQRVVGRDSVQRAFAYEAELIEAWKASAPA